MRAEIATKQAMHASLRINLRQASRWAASSGACGNGAGVSRVRASDRCSRPG